MSRIGNRIIELPEGVTLTIDAENLIKVNGPKGELNCKVDKLIKVSQDEGKITLTKLTNAKESQAIHGLYNSLISNMVIGVTEGYKKTLELVGVGYKASSEGNILDLNLGFSHSILMAIPKELSVIAEMAKGKNPLVHIEGIDKQLVGQIAAKIKSLRKPEPYKGKGVRYQGEYIRRKAGKTSAK